MTCRNIKVFHVQCTSVYQVFAVLWLFASGENIQGDSVLPVVFGDGMGNRIVHAMPP